jgi:hypothetical protein
MGRVLATIIVLIILALGAGFLWLGAFPPHPPHARPVEQTIPNSAVGGGD